MKLGSVLLIVFASGLIMFAQVQPAQVQPVPVYNATPGYGYVNTGGYVTSAPAYGWSLYAPIVHLSTAAPTVGATNATSGNTAGATNSTLSVAPVATPFGVVTEVVNPMPMAMQPQPAAGNTGANTNTAGTAPLNLGVGAAPGLVATTTGIGTQNLGEIARSYRQKEATARVRTYTNDDIQRINQQSGGTAGATINAGSSNPTSPNARGSPVLSQPGGTTNPAGNPANPSTITPENTPRTAPQQTQPTQPQRNPPPPLGANQSEPRQDDATLMAQARPADNPPASSEQTAPPAGELPRTGSMLPAAAILGFLAAATGLLARYR